jgi:hypothetical protein
MAELQLYFVAEVFRPPSQFMEGFPHLADPPMAEKPSATSIAHQKECKLFGVNFTIYFLTNLLQILPSLRI